MKKYLPVIKTNTLFAAFTGEEILTILPCVEGQTAAYKNGEALILAGDKVSKIGLVLEGELSVTEVDMNGNQHLISKLRPGDVFGETLVVLGKTAKFSVQADSSVVVLLLSYSKIISSCTNACAFHARLVNNLVRTLASKLVEMQAKLAIVHKGSIRQKLEAYFEMRAREVGISTDSEGCAEFDIPLTRSELAEYIGANRSAMHRELKHMEEEGLIQISGRRIVYMP